MFDVKKIHNRISDGEFGENTLNNMKTKQKPNEVTKTITLTEQQAYNVIGYLYAWKKVFQNYDTELAYNAYYQETLCKKSGEEDIKAEEKALDKAYNNTVNLMDTIREKLGRLTLKIKAEEQVLAE